MREKHGGPLSSRVLGSAGKRKGVICILRSLSLLYEYGPGRSTGTQTPGLGVSQPGSSVGTPAASVMGRVALTSSQWHAETPQRFGRACPHPRCPGGSCRSCFGAQRHLGMVGVGVTVSSSGPTRLGGHVHGPRNDPRTRFRDLRVPGKHLQPGVLGCWKVGRGEALIVVDT